MLSADDIDSRLEDRSIVLRVTDPTSLSPYDPDQGFSATSSEFQSLSKNQFKKRYSGLRYAYSWKKYENTLDSMTFHILGGWGNDHRFEHIAAPSPWISTTADMDWCIWEIARRLVVLRMTWVDSSVIDVRRPKVRGVGLRPERRIPGDTDERVKAGNFARASSEVLWYGRIIDDDIRQVDTWTRTQPGFKLPAEYRIPPRRRAPGATWLETLCWNPRVDDFYSAQAKIAYRRDQVETSRKPRKYVCLSDDSYDDYY